MFKPEPGKRYDMPAVFGVSELRGQVTFGESHMIAHSFRTDKAALEPLIPYHFSPAESAKVIIFSRMLIDVDWLGGRNYHLVRVAAEVNAKDGDRVITAPYGLVVWETDSHPVIAGREYLGHSKIVGEIPEHERSDDTAAFECYEYGTRLLRCEVSHIAPVGDDAIAQANSVGDKVTLGWKYIPGPNGTVDADYPVKSITRGQVSEMWTGVSTITFDRPTWQQCPFSARIIQTLSALPVVEVLPATLTVSKGEVLDRDATSRLE